MSARPRGFIEWTPRRDSLELLEQERIDRLIVVERLRAAGITAND